MATETEQKTTQGLEDALKEPSPEQAEVSPEKEPTDELKPDQELKAKEGEKVKPKTAEEIFESRVQAEADKRTNRSRETREADTALIRRLGEENKAFKSEQGTKGLSKAMEAILAEDEDNGEEPDKIKTRREYFNDITAKIKEYSQQSTEVEEVASLSTLMAEKLDKGITEKFNLLDSNPVVRARGAVEAITDAVHFLQREQAFYKILEEIPLLRKGSEVRQQIEGFVDQYLELSDQKGRDLLFEKGKQEFRITSKKAPPVSSDGSGGTSLPKFGANVDTVANLTKAFSKK